MTTKMFYEIDAFDNNNEKIGSTGKQRSDSLVNQFLQCIYGSMNYSQTVTSVTGAGCNVAGQGTQRMTVNAAVNTDTYGIVVGSGTTPVSNTQFCLQSKIPHGSSPGNLVYGTCLINYPTITSNSVSINFNRGFTNNSGGDVVIYELGAYVNNNSCATMILRDVLTTPWTVVAGTSAMVHYYIETFL